jgi:hypothetical protein
MQIYNSPQKIVLLVNATPEEESGIGEELGIMACRRPGLRVVGYETASRERQVSFVPSEPNADAPRQEVSLQEWRTHFCNFLHLGC